jgi:FkbM family methyltransferase
MKNVQNANVKRSGGRRSCLASDAVLGKLVRLPLRLIPKKTVVPILRGPGHGLKWIVGSYNHSCWLGWYEFEKQVIAEKCLRAGDVVYDLGAHVGYMTLIFSRLVGESGCVVAFEPLEANYRLLEKHLALNKITNVKLVKGGVGSRTEVAQFRTGADSSTGSVDPLGNQQVQLYSLIDHITTNNLPKPNLVKMDIEGAEEQVVPDLLEFLRRSDARLLLSTHGDLITSKLTGLLSTEGFRVEPLQWLHRPREKRVDNATLILATP